MTTGLTQEAISGELSDIVSAFKHNLLQANSIEIARLLEQIRAWFDKQPDNSKHADDINIIQLLHQVCIYCLNVLLNGHS